MNLLDSLLGQKKDEFQDFANRFDQGRPSEGYSEDEVRERYQQVASGLSPQEYEESARDAFDRLSPQERQEFYQYLRQQARDRQVDFDGVQWDNDDVYQDPGQLASFTSRVNQRQPNFLQGLLQGGSGNSATKGALAGIAAMAFKKVLGR